MAVRARSPCICDYLCDVQPDSICGLSLRFMYHGSTKKEGQSFSLSSCMQVKPHLERQQADLRSIAMSHTQRHMQTLHQFLQGCGSLARMPHLQMHHVVLDKASSN